MDSDYKNITFFMGYDDPKLWRGGVFLGNISIEESKKLNSWTCFLPTQSENLIKDILEGREVSFYK